MYLFSCFLRALLGKNALNEIQVVQIKESDKIFKKKEKKYQCPKGKGTNRTLRPMRDAYLGEIEEFEACARKPNCIKNLIIIEQSNCRKIKT